MLSRDGGSATLERRQIDPIPFLAEREIVFVCVSSPADCEPAHGDRIQVETRAA